MGPEAGKLTAAPSRRAHTAPLCPDLPSRLDPSRFSACRVGNPAYYRIANHYRFIMQEMFDCRGFHKLIIVEDDMLFAPDFFAYFEATAPLLDEVSMSSSFTYNCFNLIVSICHC